MNTELLQIKGGTIVSLRLRKKGVVRGRRPCNDDYVHTVIFTGWTYRELCELSLNSLLEMEMEGHLHRDLIAEVNAMGYALTIPEAMEASYEVKESFRKVLRSSKKDGSSSSRESVFAPLEMNGRVIRGARVYIGEGDRSDPRAPKTGAVYLSGLKMGERVLQPARKHHFPRNKSGKTAAKHLLRRRLPIGRYVQYILPPNMGARIKFGKSAAAAAAADGIILKPEAVADVVALASHSEKESS